MSDAEMEQIMQNNLKLLESNGNPFNVGGMVSSYDDSYHWTLNPEYMKRG